MSKKKVKSEAFKQRKREANAKRKKAKPKKPQKVKVVPVVDAPITNDIGLSPIVD
jgi:hypothetical protein